MLTKKDKTLCFFNTEKRHLTAVLAVSMTGDVCCQLLYVRQASYGCLSKCVVHVQPASMSELLTVHPVPAIYVECGQFSWLPNLQRNNEGNGSQGRCYPRLLYHSFTIAICQREQAISERNYPTLKTAVKCTRLLLA